MLATVVTVHNPFQPALHREVKAIRRRCRVRKLAPNTQQPFICLHNGAPLLRADWDTFISDGDVVAFVTLPQGGGGGGSNPLKLIISLAISYFSGGLAAGLLGPAMAGTEVAFGITAGQLLGGAISFAGKMLLNVMMPDGGGPKAPSTHQAAALAAPSPTYSIGAQGNAARMGSPIPSIYGRHLIYPDFGAEPFTEYAGNEQYLYQLFVIGQGEYDIEAIRIEDTPIASFAEITYEVKSNGEQVTLMPTNVSTASEVAGQELSATAVGPFVVNPAGTTANYISVDVVAPRGLFYANDNGGLDAVSASFKAEARQINDAGTAIGSWLTLGTHTLNAATTTPQRNSYRYTLATPGRYEVKLTRLDAKATGSRYGHELDWAMARAYLPGVQNYAGVTVVAMRMRATNNLSAAASRKVNMIVTRKLPIWNGTTWSAPTATTNPAWALADILRADYGAKASVSRIDLAQLLTLSSTWAARGDSFNGIFDNKQTVWEALGIVARAGRCKPYLQGGIVRFTRDQTVSLPVALFNMRNIVRGSVKMTYLVTGDETADAVEVTYFDAATWSNKTVQASLPGHSADRIAKVSMFGITGRDQAWREGRYMAAANRYRRQLITFTTDMEGLIPSFGDLIAIAHDRPTWGTSGEITAYDSGTKVVTLTEPVTFTVGNHYCAFRKRDGSFSGPWLVTAGVDAYHVVLDVALDFTPDLGSDRERTYFSFGPGEEYRKLARVTAIKPRGMNRVEITCVNEDAAVHAADTGTTPADSVYWNLPAKITSPTTSGLTVQLGGSSTAPLLTANWAGAAGADHYDVEYSYDSGNSWLRAGSPSSTNISFPAIRGVVSVRVRGVGTSAGAWETWTGDPFLAAPPDVAQFLVSVQPDGTRQFDAAMPGAIPPDMLGYVIKYRLGTGWTWDDLYYLYDGAITAMPFETNQLAAGSYTFAIKAVDDSGHFSENANFIVADLADPRLAGVIYATRSELYGWAGIKTNCYLEPEINALSASDSTTWADLTTWGAWARWNSTPAGSMTYQENVIDLGASVPFTPLVSAIADGTQTIEVATSNDNVTYSAWVASGSLVTARYIKVRITLAGSFPMLYSLDIKLSGAVIQEDINDKLTSTLTGSYRIGVGDIRLPIVKSYSLLTQVQVTLQNVGSGWSWELIDKNVSVGPRIKIYNASNALADCTIDASIKGA